MNKFSNGIIKVERSGEFVLTLPRWVLEKQRPPFEYEALYIYRGPVSEKIGAVKLPLALY